MNYIGYDCPVCHKPFADGDDIVVCPVCGAPHHRECYKQQGGCGLEENHAKGISWEEHVGPAAGSQQAPNQQQYGRPGYDSNAYQGNSGVQRCPSCGSVNPADGIFCQVCGTMIRRNNQNGAYGAGAAGPFYNNNNNQNPHQQYQSMYSGPAYSPYGGMNPEETLGEATVKEVATYVGPSSNFYLSRFRLIKANGRSSSFCWSGLLFGFLYFFYRKMYRVAIPMLIIFLFSMIPSFVYSYEYLREISMQYATVPFPLPVIETATLQNLALISNVAQMANFAVTMVAGFMGHKLYLQDINRKIAAIKAKTQGESTDEYIRTLSREGGVTNVVPAVLVGLLLLVYIGVSMAIALLLNLSV